MSVFRMGLLGAAAALVMASASPAAAHDGYRGEGVVNCVRSVCNFGVRGYRHHHRHHRHWGYARVITPSPYYLVDQGPVYNVPAIPYREPSVIYDIDAAAYPYAGLRTYGPRVFYGGVRYRHRRWGHRFHHAHRSHHHARHRHHRAAGYAAYYGKPYYARHGARHRHGGAWR